MNEEVFKIDPKIIEQIKENAKTYQANRFSLLDANKELEKTLSEVSKSSKEKCEREIQNNENLKKLVDYNSEITEYNRQLVTLNESILRKINFVNTSLDFVIEAIVENTEITKKDGIEHNALLLELITIMESKDKDKIKEFLGGLTGNVAAGVMVEYLKFKLGIS
ncbi:hypothetical protein FC820_10600 [Clostridium sporogenes]|uniref:hypothetical protein n=1 Tax=Clostridium sporogenes TaxID=1509 RepID=UPI0013D19F84|nr:hypothetical protein [Clostridium sporogenes]EJE7236753.1 hypothetical protein [Clostridium botulinum]NFE80253.1 hypothetical protein [Clostridium sporogenes]NFG68759.1 hypothetical protein [Clostridium sporogenes]